MFSMFQSRKFDLPVCPQKKPQHMCEVQDKTYAILVPTARTHVFWLQGEGDNSCWEILICAVCGYFPNLLCVHVVALKAVYKFEHRSQQ